MALGRFVTVTLAAALLTACGHRPGTTDTDPDLGGSWHLVEGTDERGALDLAGREVTLRVEAGRVAGTSGCNVYAGRVRTDGSAVTLGELGGTEMACEPAVMDLEGRYLAALGAVEHGERDGDTLDLSGPGVTLRFELTPPPSPAALVGTTWALESLVDGETVSTPASEGQLRFLDAGVLVGDITCGPLHARYSLHGRRVVITELQERDPAAGRCPDDVEAQHAHVVDVLRGGFTARVDGRTLTLANAEGLGLVLRAEPLRGGAPGQ